MNTKWMMAKINFDSTGLTNEAELHFMNLSNINGWTINHNPKEQVVALTTQLEVLTTVMTSLKKNQGVTPTNQPPSTLINILHRSITTPFMNDV